MAEIQVKERSHNDQLNKREEHTMSNRVPAASDQVGKARDRGHKGMLNRPFPALYCNQIGYALEGHTQIGPDRGANQQVENQKVAINFRSS